MSKRYVPTDAECRCRLCGDSIAVPALWIDDQPPSRECIEGAERATDCRQAMKNARVAAWLLKTRDEIREKGK